MLDFYKKRTALYTIIGRVFAQSHSKVFLVFGGGIKIIQVCIPSTISFMVKHRIICTLSDAVKWGFILYGEYKNW